MIKPAAVQFTLIKCYTKFIVLARKSKISAAKFLGFEKLRRAIRQICQLFSLNPALVRASSGQPLAEFLGGAMWAKSRRVRRNKETIIIKEPAIARLLFADARLAWL
jgi:hypothetical protein